MSRVLEGIRVLDLSRVLAGPYCTMTLGDLGAEVIKVERAGVGDDLRYWGPPFAEGGESVYFLALNRNKRSITLNLRTEEGRAILRELAAKSDVLVENFRAGAMDKMGIGYDVLRRDNPGLIHCSITGFGGRGPYKDLPGYDVVIQAMGGLMSITGEPEGRPTKVGVAIVDILTGLFATIGILGALNERNRTGLGKRVEVSLLEANLAALINVGAGYLITGKKPRRLGNAHPNVAPYELYPTKDGHIVIAVGNDEQWQRFCRAAGLEAEANDERFRTNAARLEHRAELTELLERVMQQRTTAEWMTLLREHEVPVGPVMGVDEILNDPHVQALGIIKTLMHPTVGEMRVVGSPLTISDSSTDPTKAPPLLGEDTDAVLKELLGKSEEEIERLRQAGVI